MIISSCTLKIQKKSLTPIFRFRGIPELKNDEGDTNFAKKVKKKMGENAGIFQGVKLGENAGILQGSIFF